MIYFLLAFAMALAVALFWTRLGEAALVLTMFTPAVAVILTRSFFTGEGLRSAPRDLGLTRTGWRLWPLAIALPLLLLFPGYLLVWVLEPGSFQLAADLNPVKAVVQLVISLAIGTLLGALGEELGWRGYLLPRLLPIGRRKAMFLTGFAHGLWHLPLILITPFYHDAGLPLLVVPLFLVVLTLAGGVYGSFRLLSGAIWPAALMHRALNLFWDKFEGLTAKGPDATGLKEYLAGETGLVTLVMVAIAVALILRLTKNRPDLA